MKAAIFTVLVSVFSLSVAVSTAHGADDLPSNGDDSTMTCQERADQLSAKNRECLSIDLDFNSTEEASKQCKADRDQMEADLKSNCPDQPVPGVNPDGH